MSSDFNLASFIHLPLYSFTSLFIYLFIHLPLYSFSCLARLGVILAIQWGAWSLWYTSYLFLCA